MRAHIVENGIVTNTIEVESLNFMPGLIDASIGGAIGWSWNGNTFTPPAPNPEPVPTVVGSGQIRVSMISMGYADDDNELNILIEGILGNITDSTQKAIAITLWRNASEFRRNHPFIEMVQTSLNKTSADIDDLFRLANTF